MLLPKIMFSGGRKGEWEKVNYETIHPSAASRNVDSESGLTWSHR